MKSEKTTERALLPGYLDEILSDPCNELVEKALDEGGVAIGYTCNFVPDVMLNAAGLFPLRLRAPGISGTEMADVYLSSVICPYTRSILEFALDRRYDFLGGWVFAASCDHMRRLYDNLDYLSDPGFVHILDVPHKRTDAALDWYEDELRGLAGSLSAYFGIQIDEDALGESVVERNRVMSLLRCIGEKRREVFPPLRGGEFHRLMLFALTSPLWLAEPLLRDYLESLERSEKKTGCRARLMVVGGQLDDPAFIDAIESQGALVVADRFCTGSMPGAEDILIEENPFRGTARHYLCRMRCPRMMEDFTSRVKEICDTVRRCNVDGVVLQGIKFCDTWGVEASPFVAALRAEGIPVLRLEREYRLSGEGQLRTRVQAFIESMGK